MATEQASKVKLRPLGNRVLAQRLESEETVKGGIYLPDSAKKKQEQARVIAVGPGKTNSEGKTTPMPVNAGDIILMSKYSGQEVTIDDQEYIIASADDIVAIVEE